ncbi:flagellar hook protein FlgE [Pseudomonas sp. Bc-h]|jgi:flagellar hook protein FlgE|uniref:flagellar hook protein FlgE n=1 Tax=unclassified Pseudomonas TaxID=196821 RepID=UPI0009DB4C33|nr:MULTISPECIES: flagellar hook protein FlgE [unclassified Pseudomonas]MDE1193974.1 flagellar hook protein FlgE [Pseudomonas sp.]OQR26962.1 flagellar hook protein FlgE [Pseudomonas sp. Bc-h]
MSFNIGLSGLYAANKSLDVTGNNIANVATVGFKSSRAEFADQYAQSIRGTSGGTNVGSGVTTAAVTQSFTQGALTTGTGRDLDLAINGNGFFMVSNNGEKLYTRAGNFHTDSAGNIIDTNGNNLQGYGVDANGNVKTGVLTNLKVDTSNMPPKATSSITISSNLDSTKEINTAAAFDPEKVETYDLTYSTKIYDSQGNEHTLDQYFRKTGLNTWDMYSLVDGRSINDPTKTTPDVTNLTFDSAGNMVTSPAPTSTANMVVNTDGTFTVANWIPGQSKTVGSTTTWAANGAAAATGGMKLDMLATTQTNAAGGAIAKNQDGNYTGQISAMNVDATGNLFATYTNGESRTIGQVALTSFANVQGLSPAGGTMWRETYASGIPVTGAPESGTLGNITGSALEESNVDLTTELVELIKAQSNYQANAKTISTESTIMQTTIQMA